MEKKKSKAGKYFTDNSNMGPISTDMVGTMAWVEGSGWVIVDALFYQSTWGFTFLVEDEKGELFECNYSQIHMNGQPE